MKQVLSTLLLVSLCTVKLCATNYVVLAWFVHQQAIQRKQAADRPSEIRKLQNEIENKHRIIEKLYLKSQTLLRDSAPLFYDDPATLCYQYNEARIAQIQRELQIAQQRFAKLTEQDSE